MPKRESKPPEEKPGTEPEPAPDTPAAGDAWERALAMKKQQAEGGWPWQPKQKRERKKRNPGRG